MNPVQENRFEYKGYPCVVLFMPLCHRCGYVGIKKGGEYYKKNFDDIPVNCHGGLTYAASRLHHQNDKDIWWIGFDCAHYGDGNDFEKGKEYFKNDESVLKQIEIMSAFPSYKKGKIWKKEEVEAECKNIVEQLFELEVENERVHKN